MADPGLSIVLPFLVGLIIGIVEAYFVYEDENMTSGKQFIGDMWHGLLFALLGVMVAANVPWILSQGWLPGFVEGLLFVDGNGNSLVVSILITLVLLIKMVGSHAIKGVSGQGFKEKFWHKLTIALAVGFSPYYIMLFAPMLEPVAAVFPSWLPF